MQDYSGTLTPQPLTKEAMDKRLALMTDIIFPGIGDKISAQNKKVYESFCKAHKILVDDFPPGALVMKATTDRKSKVDPKFEGPFMVIRRNRGGAYILRDATGEIVEKVPANHLRIISNKGHPTQESFVVEKILAHNDMDPKNRKYLVKWRNFDPSYNSWEPVENFNTHGAIQEYWKQQGEAEWATVKLKETQLTKPGKQEPHKPKDSGHHRSSHARRPEESAPTPKRFKGAARNKAGVKRAGGG